MINERKSCRAKKRNWVHENMKTYESEINFRNCEICVSVVEKGRFETKQWSIREMALVAAS